MAIWSYLLPSISTALMRPRRPKQYCLQLDIALWHIKLGLRHSICSNPFFRFGSRSQVIYWKGDLAIVFLFWPDFCKYNCDLFFLPQVSTCREGKLGGFFFVCFFCHPSRLGLVRDLGCAPFLGPYFFLLSLRDGYPTRSYTFDRH